MTESFVFLIDRTAVMGHSGNIILNFFLTMPWYRTFTLAWVIALKKYSWSLKQVFLTQALTGILIEQQGAIFMVDLHRNYLCILYFYSFFTNSKSVFHARKGQQTKISTSPNFNRGSSFSFGFYR